MRGLYWCLTSYIQYSARRSHGDLNITTYLSRCRGDARWARPLESLGHVVHAALGARSMWVFVLVLVLVHVAPQSRHSLI